ncbi:hypothetical protein O0L34_g18594 [Tuta absoluta]|nr:hypothetical protein O0L34_g18594 [Tuta absoluta]
MWWRFLTFCVLVTFVLFVVLSCILGRPVIYLFFHRCCEDDIENDQVIFENFENNYLREKLVGVHIVEENSDEAASDSEVEDVIEAIKTKLNVHDPKTRVELDILKENDNETSSELVLKVTELDNEITSVINETGKENTTFNDQLSDSQEIEGKLSKNNVLSELDSDEDSSPEVTTQSSVTRIKLSPIKLIESRKIINQSEIVLSDRKESNSFSTIK